MSNGIAYWELYSRWAAVKRDGRWRVWSTEYSKLAPEPNDYGPDDYRAAFNRAQELNRAERESLQARFADKLAFKKIEVGDTITVAQDDGGATKQALTEKGWSDPVPTDNPFLAGVTMPTEKNTEAADPGPKPSNPFPHITLG